jgi:hypothetical protein
MINPKIHVWTLRRICALTSVAVCIFGTPPSNQQNSDPPAGALGQSDPLDVPQTKVIQGTRDQALAYYKETLDLLGLNPGGHDGADLVADGDANLPIDPILMEHIHTLWRR